MTLAIRPRRRVGLALAALAALACAFATQTSPADAASTSFATYKTKGCADAPKWRIGYRFFFRSPNGATLPRDGSFNAAKRASRKFVEQIGTFSQCGVRAQIELFDEGDALFTGCAEEAGDCNFARMFPADTPSFRKARKLDAVFYRYPEQGSESPGTMAPLAGTGYGARFPVDNVRPDFDEGDPWRNLLLHEWLHMVVAHVSRANWPRPSGGDPVHAGCAIEPYKSGDFRTFDGPCIAQGRYYRDLMRGKVKLNGKDKGTTEKLWLRCGTPAKPPEGDDRRSCQRSKSVF